MKSGVTRSSLLFGRMSRLDKSKLMEQMWALAEPIAARLNLTVWDIRWVTEGGERFLRFFIDKPGGIFIDDCEAFHRAIDPALDECDPIETAYMLEVSSPGIGRELSRPAHFVRYLGEPVIVRLFRAVDGQKQWRGRLTAADEQSLRLDIDGAEHTFPRAGITRVNLDEDVQF